MAASIETIVDRVYEAAVIPERWPSVLDSVARLSRTVGGILFTVEHTPASSRVSSPHPGIRCVASDSVSDLFASTLSKGWTGCIRGQRTLALDHAGFVTDADICTTDEIARHPFYTYARKKGFGWATGLSVKAPSGDTLLFNWERRFEDGPIDRETVQRLDGIKGHLARAALMASRIGLERAKTATETLRALGLPAAVLSHRKRILAANPLFEALMPDVVDEHAGGTMHLVDRRAGPLFEAAVTTIAQNHWGGSIGPDRVLSIPLPAGADREAMVIHALPVKRSAYDVFDLAASIVIVTPVRPNAMPSPDIIQGLFDLTPAEARVARCITGGNSIEEIARASGTSEGTVRTQLKAVFSKTGVSRQGALVSLLGAVSPVR